MKIRKKHIIYCSIGTLVFILVTLIVLFFLIPTSSVYAVETENNNLGIAVSPAKELLRVKNMAPGDRDSAPLTVMNKGKNNFYFDISAELQSGDKLYNYLDLAITDQNNKVLYSGKMKDLRNLNLGMLGVSKDATFKVTVGLPIEADNEYQGIYTHMKFVLNATDRPLLHDRE